MQFTFNNQRWEKTSVNDTYVFAKKINADGKAGKGRPSKFLRADLAAVGIEFSDVITTESDEPVGEAMVTPEVPELVEDSTLVNLEPRFESGEDEFVGTLIN